MITSQKALLRATSRIVTVGAALGIALATGATAASAAPVAPARSAAVQAAPVYGGDDGDCSGVIVLLCN